MSGTNPLEKMNDPFKRDLRRRFREALPPEMRMIDEAMSQSDMAKAIRAIESHDPELLAELAAAHKPAAQQTPVEDDYVPPARTDGAHPRMHPGSEDSWFALNGEKLQAAALERLVAKQAQALGDVMSHSAVMRQAGLDVDGEGHGAHGAVRGHKSGAARPEGVSDTKGTGFGGGKAGA